MMWRGRRHGWHGWAGAEVDNSVIDAIGVVEGMTIVDVGSGVGRFSIPMARRAGPRGVVYAIDIDQGALNELSERAAREGLNNIKTISADVTNGVPLDSSVADLVLMANVFHDFVHVGASERVLAEAYRILKPGGLLVIIDFKTGFTVMGPPPWLRVEPEKVVEIAVKADFRNPELKDLSPTHYILRFRRP